ncbi:MAG: hypothetical protein ABI353_07880 [Isosphaeraceae bacterium]
MLGDDRRQFGEFGDLVPGGFAIVEAGFDSQSGVTADIGRGPICDDLMDPRRRQVKPMMATMSGLSSRASPGGPLEDQLGSVERVGRRRRGTIGRVASELVEEFSDPGPEHGDPSQGGVEFTTQPSALRTTGTGMWFGSTHRQ